MSQAEHYAYHYSAQNKPRCLPPNDPPFHTPKNGSVLQHLEHRITKDTYENNVYPLQCQDIFRQLHAKAPNCSVSGLTLSEHKTVEGIPRIFVLDIRNQSSLNRVLTESPFSAVRKQGEQLSRAKYGA